MEKEIEIPEGYEARIEGNKVILEPMESEDEKIRKEIIAFIDWTESRGSISNNDWFQKKRPAAWIAYLERQKEQKSNLELIKQTWYTEGYTDGKFKREPMWNIKTGKGGPRYEKNEKYGQPLEQKPSEWSEDIIRKAVKEVGLTQHQINWFKTNVFPPEREWSEDYREEDIQTRFAFYTYKDEPSILYLSNVFVEETSRNHGFGTRILKAAEKAAEAIGAITICLKVKQDSPANTWYRKRGYGYMTFEDGYDWLEKNLEYLKPAKSTEWSEEDDKLLNYAISMTDDAQVKRFLESLRYQPKQEWSKEDEEMFQELLTDIIYAKNELNKKGCEGLAKSALNAFNWLNMRFKSLRPQPNGNLAISFMNYLNEHRQDGKMCLSNGECEDIDKAFKENDWAKIIRYAKKYSSSWKPSDK